MGARGPTGHHGFDHGHAAKMQFMNFLTEQRIAPADGRPHTISEFRQHYGGDY
eukprot:gene42679-4923_t